MAITTGILIFDDAEELDFVGPALSPGGVYNIVVTNPGGLSGTLRNGYVSRFSDIVPLSPSTRRSLKAAG